MVIAIIAVLAAIVLVNVTQYISKGKDAAIQGDMASMLTDSAIYFDSSVANASALCADTASGFATAYTAAQGQKPSAGTVDCDGSGTDKTWRAVVQLNNKGTCTTTAWYCVDSTGNKKVVCDTTPVGAATVCP